MKYESLCELKVAMNLGKLPDGATLVVAPDIVWIDSDDVDFQMSRDELAMEALQMLGLPAKLWVE